MANLRKLALALIALAGCSPEPEFVPFERPPAGFEAEVADNPHWLTDPPGARFEKPGTYQVWARNAYPTDARSNVATIKIR